MSVPLDQPGLPDIGRVPLYLVDATKSVERAPSRIALGLIRLRGWQVHRLEPVPADLVGSAAYLVRVSYEFDIAPDVQAPRWAEVGFEFPEPDVVVYDAMPHRVVDPADAASYELTGQLNFVPRDRGELWPVGSAAAHIAMPALVPRIDSFGLSGSLIRWRHTAEVPAGAHTGWLVLLVPEKWREVPVVAAGTYYVETDPGLRLRPAGRRDAFAVRLPAAAAAGEPAPLLLGTARPGTAGPAGTRVFVSYAHESATHKVAVAELCQLLSGQGLDVRFDQQDLHLRRNWDQWVNTQLRRADYVIVVASPAYRGASEGALPAGERLGVLSEYERLAELRYRDRDTWTKKILPVILPGQSRDDIPLSFLPSIADYYEITSLSAAGAADLLKVLLHPTAPPAS